MTSPEITRNDLYAFVDNQLDSETQAGVLAAIQRDRQLADRVNRLRNMKALVAFAHQNPPLPPWTPSIDVSRRGRALFWPVAAMILLLVTLFMTWTGYGPGAPGTAPVFEDISRFDPDEPHPERILLHVSSMDPERIQKTFNAVETLLTDPKKQNRQTRVEVVAAADGLGLLRQGSPYEARIHSIASGHDNVEFLACGIAMQNAAMKEGAPIKLLPDADKVDAALEQILRRLKQGWHYVRS